MRGKLIVIEGLDGSGKSTQVELLKQKLIDNNIKLRQIKLPDYDNKSSTLVKMYLGGEFGKKPGDVNAFAASCFYKLLEFRNDFLPASIACIVNSVSVVYLFSSIKAKHNI